MRDKPLRLVKEYGVCGEKKAKPGGKRKKKKLKEVTKPQMSPSASGRTSIKR